MYPSAYIDYLVYFHGPRDYFECHEVLEEYWKEGARKQAIWVGLIQLAVSLYHFRRENRVGAKRMIESAIHYIKKHPVNSLGLNQELLLREMNDVKSRLARNLPYDDIDLPINNMKLLKLCQQRCADYNYIWGTPSNMDNTYLIHKHKLRDRTEVILERKLQLEVKKR